MLETAESGNHGSSHLTSCRIPVYVSGTYDFNRRVREICIGLRLSSMIAFGS